MVDRTNVPSRTLFIGDNLKVLRGINSESVDLIYLNPPRLSGKTQQKGLAMTSAHIVWYDETGTFWPMSPALLAEIELRRPGVTTVVEAAKIIHGDSMASYLAFLSIRLLELQRVLKPAGSIYLQCDPRVSHYLKAIMDAVFGAENFKNEIICRRRRLPSGGRRWDWVHDTLLFYTGWRKHRWNRILQEHLPEYWARNYRNEDDRGRHNLIRLIGPGRTGDDREIEWRGYDPSKAGMHWEVPLKTLRKEYPDTDDLGELGTQEKLDLLDRVGLVHWPATGGAPRYKVYEEMADNAPISDVITTVDPIQTTSGEYTGWPEQTPEELLDLIIRASTNPGEVVLDPFCGSGSACVVAEKLGRRWIAIDSSGDAVSVLRLRLETEVGADLYEPDNYPVSVRMEAPGRLDLDSKATLMDPQETKATLYAQQKHKCNGCRYELPQHLLTIHRLSPVPRRGPDSLSNLQLLCYFCKAMLGRNDMDHLRIQLHYRAIRRLGQGAEV